MANGFMDRPTHGGYLSIPGLSDDVTKGWFMPNFRDSLLSVPRLCDTGHTVFFDRSGVYVHKDGKVVLQGVRDTRTGLWEVPKQAERVRTAYTAHDAQPQVSRYQPVDTRTNVQYNRACMIHEVQ